MIKKGFIIVFAVFDAFLVVGVTGQLIGLIRACLQ